MKYAVPQSQSCSTPCGTEAYAIAPHGGPMDFFGVKNTINPVNNASALATRSIGTTHSGDRLASSDTPPPYPRGRPAALSAPDFDKMWEPAPARSRYAISRGLQNFWAIRSVELTP